MNEHPHLCRPKSPVPHTHTHTQTWVAEKEMTVSYQILWLAWRPQTELRCLRAELIRLGKYHAGKVCWHSLGHSRCYRPTKTSYNNKPSRYSLRGLWAAIHHIHCHYINTFSDYYSHIMLLTCLEPTKARKNKHIHGWWNKPSSDITFFFKSPFQLIIIYIQYLLIVNYIIDL